MKKENIGLYRDDEMVILQIYSGPAIQKYCYILQVLKLKEKENK